MESNFDYFDTHCHLNLPEFAADWPVILRQSQDERIALLVAGTDLPSSQLAGQIASSAPQTCWGSVGFHPSVVASDSDWQVLEQLLVNKQIRAIGECGLDYYRTTDLSLRKKQQEQFWRQLILSSQHDLAVIVHCREAFSDLWTILKEWRQQDQAQEQKINLHFFSGDLSWAKKFLDLDCYLSFAGPVTFSHQADEVVTYAPLTRLLSETDSPYVAPVPYRGQRNLPAHVALIAKRLADIRPEAKPQVLTALVANAFAFFSLPQV